LQDCGQPKAKVAAAFIERRCAGTKVTWHNKKIQEFAPAWYRKFDLVVAGLDNVAARSWLCETLWDLADCDADGEVDFSTIIPMIDGGTEGFGGQVRVFVPTMVRGCCCSRAH
jgi:ubiquitin-activating enzyme E1 C